VEQKPSEEVMRRVRPLLDLNVWLVAGSIDICGGAYQVRSVKVAQCRLLTMHNGVCC
jgi:hypothetical protein